MNRRYFLRSIGAAAAGSLFLPDRFLLRAESFLAHHGEPLLKTFRSSHLTFHLVEGETLHLGDPCQGPTDIPTWRQFFVDYQGYLPAELTEDFLEDNWYLTPAKLDDAMPEDVYMDQYWLRNESSSASAYHFLEGLDIGPDICHPNGEVVGHLEFIDGPFPGCDSLLVQTDDGLSLSCLQWRLEQLGHRCNFVRG